MPDRRVLCVEDDEDTRDMLKVKLSLSGLEAVVAPGTEAALRLLGRERFGLYVLDGELRNVREMSLCKQIRASDARTPIVIFSSHAFASDIEAGMLAGANAYLVKPDSSELIPTIRRLLLAAAAGESQADERYEAARQLHPATTVHESVSRGRFGGTVSRK